MRFKIWRTSQAVQPPPDAFAEQPMSASPPHEQDAAQANSPKADPIITINVSSTAEDGSAPPTRRFSTTSRSVPKADSSPVEPPQRWIKVSAGESAGPYKGYNTEMRAYKPPAVLTILDSPAHNPRSPIAWFMDQLGIQILKIVPRPRGAQILYSCEYELADLNISKSVPLPRGYCEPFISTDDFPEGSWRRIPIFTTPVPTSPFRRIKTCEIINNRTERITIAFNVFFLDTNEHDQYCRTSYEESWTYYACNLPTLQDFYEKYGQVLTRTTEEHRAAREFYMGPWKVEGRVKDTKVPKMYEESKKFLKVDGDAGRAHKAMEPPDVLTDGVEEDEA